MEYLFRGFTTEKGEQKLIIKGKEYQGEWVYGYYFCLHHMDNRNHIHHFIIPENTPIPKERPIGEIQIEVIPETVKIWTGGSKMKIYELPVGIGDYVYFFEEESEDSDIKYAIKCEKVQEIEIDEWATHFKTTYFPDLNLCNYDNVTEHVLYWDTFYWTNSRKKAQEVADMLNKN